jgi:hypothetical protein
MITTMTRSRSHTAWYMSFQVLLPGEAFAAVGTEDHGCGVVIGMVLGIEWTT